MFVLMDFVELPLLWLGVLGVCLVMFLVVFCCISNWLGYCCVLTSLILLVFWVGVSTGL